MFGRCLGYEDQYALIWVFRMIFERCNPPPNNQVPGLTIWNAKKGNYGNGVSVKTGKDSNTNWGSEVDSGDGYKNTQAYIRFNTRFPDLCGQGVPILQYLSQRDSFEYGWMDTREIWGRVEVSHQLNFGRQCWWKIGNVGAGGHAYTVCGGGTTLI